MDIQIKIGSVTVNAQLHDTPTGREIYNSLPFSHIIHVWGKEAYCSTALTLPHDNTSSESVESGDIAYWPTGNCFCLFWGQQPISAVNICGKITSDLSVLNSIRDNETISVSKQYILNTN
ncbi:MAG: cyclophilin-like fold protein [Bacteroidales bacterium]